MIYMENASCVFEKTEVGLNVVYIFVSKFTESVVLLSAVFPCKISVSLISPLLKWGVKVPSFYLLFLFLSKRFYYWLML